jgi:hypothetical protein
MRLAACCFSLWLCATPIACRTLPQTQLTIEPPVACRTITIWRMPKGNFVEPTRQDGRSTDEITTHARMDGIALAAAYHCLVTGELASRYATMVLPQSELSKVKEECILDDDLLADAWGTEISYVTRSGSLELRSAGPDRTLGTVDDISLPRSSDHLAWEVDVLDYCLGAGEYAAVADISEAR